MTAHAFLAPSSAHRWVVCPAAPTLEALYPETETSPEAAAGTACHWVIESFLHGRAVPEGHVAPNGVPVDAEMLEAAELVIKDVNECLGPWVSQLRIEQRVYIHRVHASQNWGTPDLYAWVQMSNGHWKLFVWDFKYGHKLVEVYENWQLIDYTAGILEAAKIDGVSDQVTAVCLTVIQPRAYHRDGPVRRWQCLASDLRGRINRLANAAAEATGGNPKARPDPTACEHCTARHACEALQRSAYAAVDYGHAASALNMTPEAMGLELRTLKRAKALLEARESGLEEVVTASIKRGQDVPWWALESSQGRQVFNVPAEQVITLGQMVGKDFSKREVITPKQAITKAPELAEVINAMSWRPPGASKLVPDDGTRARRIFG